MPSATLLGQALISGVLAGGLYGLLAMGLSLSWGLLRLVNLSHFALAFLAAYLVYELGTTYHVGAVVVGGDDRAGDVRGRRGATWLFESSRSTSSPRC